MKLPGWNRPLQWKNRRQNKHVFTAIYTFYVPMEDIGEKDYFSRGGFTLPLCSVFHKEGDIFRVMS